MLETLAVRLSNPLPERDDARVALRKGDINDGGPGRWAPGRLAPSRRRR